MAGLLLLLTSCGSALQVDSALQQTPAEEVGAAIKSVDAALRNYQRPESMDIVIHYGTDTRYYTLIRAWLVQRIASLESQTGGSASLEQQQELEFLSRTLRRIDLE